MDTKKGRPPIAKRRSRIHVTLSDDDIAILREFTSLTNSTPATFIREIVQIALPDIKILTESVIASQNSTINNVRDKGGAMLAKYIEEAERIQEGLFDEKK